MKSLRRIALLLAFPVVLGINARATIWTMCHPNYGYWPHYFITDELSEPWEIWYWDSEGEHSSEADLSNTTFTACVEWAVSGGYTIVC